MSELSQTQVMLNELDLVSEVERLERELRTLKLPGRIERPRRSPAIRSGLRIAMAAMVLAGAFAIGGHVPPF